MNRQDRTWQAPLGLLADVYDIVTFRFSALRSLNKFRQIRHEARRCGARTFIETGAYLGVTTRRCAPIFERVLTIEIDAALAARARAYLSDHGNVEVHHGDAVDLLPALLARPDMRDVFLFLDGHHSGGETGHGNVPEPALLELEAIARHVQKVRGFIIDDFRCFGVVPGYPSKGELLAACERLFPTFELRVNLDQLIVVSGKAR
jgi:hypothetical protein